MIMSKALTSPNPNQSPSGGVDEWGQTIPEPNESFRNRVVHPRNIDLEMRRQAARPMGKKEYARLSEEWRATAVQTYALHLPEKVQQMRVLKKRYENLRVAMNDMPDGPDKEKARADLQAIYLEGRQLGSEIKPHQELIARHRELQAKINQNAYAIQRMIEQNKINQSLEDEVEKYWEIIVDRLAQLGYKHEFKKGNKRIVDKVKMAECHENAERIYYKLKISQKVMIGLFKIGFRTMLPYGVKAQDIISEETTKELSLACQKRVTGYMTQNGAWLAVDRLDGADGLLEYVTLTDILRHYPVDERKYIPIPMGVGESRHIFWVHLAKYPHMLMGGSSGGGKSNELNVFLCTLISMHSPAEVQLVLVDLKEGLEFQNYEKVPHLLMPVVKEPDQAADVLGRLENLRADRAVMLAKARVRDIDEYNDLAALRGWDPLPRVVIIIDEFAAIKADKDTEKRVNNVIMQIVNKGRACGIHLIICTQITNVDVVPSLVKGNMNLRVAFAMPTLHNSMAILDTPEAAKLPATVKGRAVLMAGALHWQIQTPHCRVEPEIRAALERAEKWRADTPEMEATPLVELPEGNPTKAGFTEDDLIALAINNYEGELRARRIWEDIKEATGVTLDKVSTLTKQIVARGQIEYEGKQYKMRRVKGNITRLVEIDEETSAA